MLLYGSGNGISKATKEACNGTNRVYLWKINIKNDIPCFYTKIFYTKMFLWNIKMSGAVLLMNKILS